MQPTLAWIKANYAAILIIAGIWSAIATALNKTKWPRPPVGSPKWKIVLHAILIDGPAFLPSIDMRGMFGAPFNVPFVTLSNHPAPVGETLDVKEAIASIVKKAGTAIALLFFASVLSGCDWDPIDHSPNLALIIAGSYFAFCMAASLYKRLRTAATYAAPVAVVLCCLAEGCAVNWQALLKDGEACAAQVAGQALVSTINGVIASAETSIAGGNGFDSADWKNRGVALATTAGTSAVACAVAHLLGDLSGTIAGPVQPCHCAHAPVRPELRPYLEALYKRVAPRK